MMLCILSPCLLSCPSHLSSLMPPHTFLPVPNMWTSCYSFKQALLSHFRHAVPSAWNSLVTSPLPSFRLEAPSSQVLPLTPKSSKRHVCRILREPPHCLPQHLSHRSALPFGKSVSPSRHKGSVEVGTELLNVFPQPPA